MSTPTVAPARRPVADGTRETVDASGLREVSGQSLATWLVVVSVVIALVVTTTSLFGLGADWAYASETENWRLQAQGQDVGNLAAVMTLVAGAAASARGSLRGFQVWIGSLAYLAYAFVIYAMAVHFGALFLPYVAVLGLTVFSIIFGFLGWRGRAVVTAGARTLGAGVVGVIGVLFGLLWLASIVSALASGSPPPELTEAGLVANPVHVLDLALVVPGMLITAIRARRNLPGGADLLAPWLVFSALMGASIVAAMVLASAPAGPLLMLVLVTLVSAGATLVVLRATGSEEGL